MNTRTNISSIVRNVVILVGAAAVIASPAMAQEAKVTNPGVKVRVAPKTIEVIELPVVIVDPFVDPRFTIADYDHSGKIDAWDLFDFYTDWVNGKETADVNGDGIVDTLDVYLFLDCWMSAAAWGGNTTGK